MHIRKKKVIMKEIRYTPLDEAAEVIAERRDNEELQAKLAQFLGGDIPDGPFADDAQEPRAVLAEYIARPTVRDITFAQTALKAEFNPWWLTYEQDFAGDQNIKKVGIISPKFALASNMDLARQWLVPWGQRYGPLNGCSTIFSELPDVSRYWAAMRKAIMPRYDLGTCIDNVYDISEWYKRQAERSAGESSPKLATRYYPAIMGMYAARAALFMNFEAYGDFKPIAASGFEQAADVLGVDPVVVHWSPPATIRSLDGKRDVRYDQTDATFLDLKLPPRNQPFILALVTELILKELEDDSDE